MNKKRKAIIAGHICVDFTPPFECGTCSSVDEVLVPGHLIRTSAAELHPGGVVVNTGLAMNRLSRNNLDLSLVGKIGNDGFGHIIMDILRSYGADKDIIVDANSSTSYTVVLAVPGVDRIFLAHPGANDVFSPDDIDYDNCSDAMIFHFGYPTVMRKFYEDGGQAMSGMFRRVQDCGCITSLDTTALDASSEAGGLDWRGILCRTLPYVDIFMPSIEEICFMLDRSKYHELQYRANGGDVTAVISPEADVAPLAAELLDMGCKIVILKCGVSGFYYKTAGREAIAELEAKSGLELSGFDGQEGFERSFVPDRVISGTGAGDVTIAAFFTAMMNGYSFNDCIELASGAGACCVSSFNALDGLMPLEELHRKIKDGWQKQEMI